MQLAILDKKRDGTWKSAALILLIGAAVGCQDASAPSGAGDAVAATPVSDDGTPDTRPAAEQTWDTAEPMPTVPAWAADAVFYQIFPERFRNGDPQNDPTRESLEFPDGVPESWAVSPWTGDWYARAAWEQQLGGDFFENGVFNRRYGGDLQGVLDKLDYIEKLGVNVLYFNPVFYGRSLHKYDGASMHHIDPYFGPDPVGDFKLMAAETSDPKTWQWTAADKLFLKLVGELHRRKMRVIIDGVFNHTGRDFFAFADLREKQDKSPYRDWYIVQYFDDADTPQTEFRYKGWWGNDTLPEFADAEGGQDLHAGPKQYVMDVTRRWMDPDGDGDPADGIDGWRLDVANEVPPKFWRDWHALVRQLNPQAYTTAEFWQDAREFLLDCGFSATMNYHAFAYLAKGFLVDGRLSAHDFSRELELRRQEYPLAMQYALQNLIDSHDTDRLASMIVNRPTERPYKEAFRYDYDTPPFVTPRWDENYQVRAPNADERKLQRMVVLLQMTSLGAPMVYYGDESGMWGGDDPCDRLPMVWDDLKYDPQQADPRNRPREPDQVAVDRELLDFYRDAIALRQNRTELRRGSWSAVDSDDDAKFVAFSRKLGDRETLVAFNRGEKAFAWTLPQDAGKEWELALATTDGAEVGADDGKTIVSIPALTGVVLTRR